MQINEALKELNVSPDLLSSEEKQALDQDGYLVITGVFSKEEAAQMCHRLELLEQLEGEDAGKELHQEPGTARLANLVDKGKIFHVGFTHPKVLAAVAHVLEGDLKLSTLNSRSALPGEGRQGLHADWGKPVEKGEYQVCNSIWLLDDFTVENGATRIVPGTHRLDKLAGEVMADPSADHPDQVILVAPAGSVVVFNSHVWHGGTLNTTQKPRPAITAYYCRRSQSQATNQREYLSPINIKAFSPAIRCILDIE